MKRYILSLLALVATMSINAQVVRVYENGTLKETYINTADKKYKAAFEEYVPVASVSLNKTTTSINCGANETLTATLSPANATCSDVTWSSSNPSVATVDESGKVSIPSTAKYGATATITVTSVYDNKSASCTVTVVDPNLLPGKFTVAEGKTVKFTKSNLYWNGSAFKFEAKQYDYPTSWSTSHVSLFFWTKTAAKSYASSYNDGTNSTSDVPFFAASKGGLTVEGTDGLYALSSAEWNYLLNTRTNASSLYKCGVTVAGKTNCLIIAPDGYTGSIASSYNATEWATAEALGLVCLPAAGYRYGSSLGGGGTYGYCWSSYHSDIKADNACRLDFASSYVAFYDYFRYSGYSLRLVK